MFHNKRGVLASRPRKGPFRLSAELLEARTLLAAQTAAIDLLNIAGGGVGGNPKAYGVEETGVTPFSGAGWKVADVGDVNGDGFDDYVVSAPTITTDANGNPALAPSGAGTGPNTSQVFLIFGSSQVNATTVVPTLVDYLTLNADQRVGNLTAGTIGGTPFGGLGTTTQLNPTNPTVTDSFQFNGIAFTVGAGSTFNWQLGASVTPLGDINGDGFDDFMIGAPGAPDATGANPGAGRAYVIFGGTSLSNTGVTTENLDTPDNPTLPPVLTLVTNQANAALGSSGAAGIVFATDTLPDLVVGAPGANSGAGEVFVIANAGLPQGPAFPSPAFGSETLNVDTVGQLTSTTPGVIFTGQPGDGAGFSVAAVGDISHSTTNGNQSDLVIGAPDNGFSGSVTPNGLVYFIDSQTLTTFQGLATTTIPGGISAISLSQVAATSLTTGLPLPNAVPGAQFMGDTGSEAGFSVASAGIINSGPSFMIGAPINSEAYLFTNQGSTPPTGIISLVPGTLGKLTPGTQTRLTTTSPTVIVPQYTIFEGTPGDLFGYSETAVGSHFGTVGVNDIAIGAPGTSVNNIAGSGAVYWISSSNVFNQQTYNVPATIGVATTTTGGVTTLGLLGATLIASSNNTKGISTTVPPSVTTTPAFLGASISGLVLAANRNHTTDSDTIGDLIVGAPGYSLATYPLATTPVSTRRLAGSAFVVEGAFVAFTGGGTTSGPTPPTTVGPANGSVGAKALGVLGPAPLGSALIPTIAALSQYDSYQPLPETIAYAQFLPNSGWLLRMEIFSGKISAKNPNVQRRLKTLPGHTNSGVSTLNPRVFDRDTYHAAKVIKFTHKVTVIPRNRQHSVYAG